MFGERGERGGGLSGLGRKKVAEKIGQRREKKGRRKS